MSVETWTPDDDQGPQSMPSAEAKALLGTEITWQREASARRKGRNVSGTCIGVERVPGMWIRTGDNGKRYPAVRYLVRPHDGTKNTWTGEFPDRPDVKEEA